MERSAERARRPNPRWVLERMLYDQEPGSVRCLAIADFFALRRANAEIGLHAHHPQSLGLQKAVAAWAAISETVRNRELAADRARYISEGQLCVELVNAYWGADPVSDMERPDKHLMYSTEWNVAETVLRDLDDILHSRMTPLS